MAEETKDSVRYMAPSYFAQSYFGGLPTYGVVNPTPPPPKPPFFWNWRRLSPSIRLAERILRRRSP